MVTELRNDSCASPPLQWSQDIEIAMGSPGNAIRVKSGLSAHQTSVSGIDTERLADDASFIVEFDNDDPKHPQNWSTVRRAKVVLVLFLVITLSMIGSDISSPATSAIATDFGVSEVLSLLGISLYLVGYALGPILWAPWSEIQGRQIPLVLSTFGFSLFQIAVAASKDIQTHLICRFWSGFFGSSTLVIVGGSCSDMFNSQSRGLILTLTTATVFVFPAMAPIFGSFMIEAGLGWRLTQSLVGISGCVATLLLLLIGEETYPPALLISKARRLRCATKNWAIHAKQEEIGTSLFEQVASNLLRPFALLAKEPIVLAISIYMSFLYALVYLSLASYPVIFQRIYDMSLGVSSLPGVGSIVGTLLGCIFIIALQPAYLRKLDHNGGIVIPEWRLTAPIIGGAIFTAGLFMLGWTGYKSSIHWAFPTVAGVLIGFGTYAIFLPLTNYIVDAFVPVAASALAANCFLRSLTAAAFPLFSPTMFESMGVQWVFTIMGCLGLLLFPIPLIFLRYGPRLRAMSKLAH